jgi:hypothetical protein
MYINEHKKYRSFYSTLLFVITLLIIWALSACQEANVNPWLSKGNGARTSIADFPKKVGNEWVYVVWNNQSQTRDTIFVRIIADIESSIINNATLWEIYEKMQGSLEETLIQSCIIQINGDSVLRYPLEYIANDSITILDPSYYDVLYVFPLEDGKGWAHSIIIEQNDQTLYVIDTAIVRQEQNITLLAGNFDTYSIFYYSRFDNSTDIISMSNFAPNIGEVYSYYYEPSSSYASYQELLRFTLN